MQTLRYYERRGLLAAPDRNGLGHRQYRPHTVTPLRMIKGARRPGLSLDEIARVIASDDASTSIERSRLRAVKAITVAADRALATLSGHRFDWTYAARVAVTAPVDALAWARGCFQGAPAPMRAFLVAGWMLLLLEGAPRSDDVHVLGWPIVRGSPDAVLQRRSRWGLLATLVFSIDGDGVTFASGVVFHRPLARILWAPVSPVHRWAVRSVLTNAAKVAARTNRALEE